MSSISPGSRPVGDPQTAPTSTEPQTAGTGTATVTGTTGSTVIGVAQQPRVVTTQEIALAEPAVQGAAEPQGSRGKRKAAPDSQGALTHQDTKQRVDHTAPTAPGPSAQVPTAPVPTAPVPTAPLQHGEWTWQRKTAHMASVKELVKDHLQYESVAEPVLDYLGDDVHSLSAQMAADGETTLPLQPVPPEYAENRRSSQQLGRLFLIQPGGLGMGVPGFSLTPTTVTMTIPSDSKMGTDDYRLAMSCMQPQRHGKWIWFEGVPPPAVIGDDKRHLHRLLDGSYVYTTTEADRTASAGQKQPHVESVGCLIDLQAQVGGWVCVKGRTKHHGVPAMLQAIVAVLQRKGDDDDGPQPTVVVQMRSSFHPSEGCAELQMKPGYFARSYLVLHKQTIKHEDGAWLWNGSVKVSDLDEVFVRDPRGKARYADKPDAWRKAGFGDFVRVAGMDGLCLGHEVSPDRLEGPPNLMLVFKSDQDEILDIDLLNVSHPSVAAQAHTLVIGPELAHLARLVGGIGGSLKGVLYRIDMDRAAPPQPVEPAAQPSSTKGASFDALAHHQASQLWAFVRVGGHEMLLMQTFAASHGPAQLHLMGPSGAISGPGVREQVFTQSGQRKSQYVLPYGTLPVQVLTAPSLGQPASVPVLLPPAAAEPGLPTPDTKSSQPVATQDTSGPATQMTHLEALAVLNIEQPDNLSRRAILDAFNDFSAANHPSLHPKDDKDEVQARYRRGEAARDVLLVATPPEKAVKKTD